MLEISKLEKGSEEREIQSRYLFEQIKNFSKEERAEVNDFLFNHYTNDHDNKESGTIPKDDKGN
jgi:hypothetical protein